MSANNFEAYAYTGYDFDNDDYTEDYPHKIVAHINGNIETWLVKGVSGFLCYLFAGSEPYTRKRWTECTSAEEDEIIDDLTRKEFDRYTALGILFG